MEAEADSLFSSYRERVLEHVFVGEVLRELWLRGLFQVEVLRAEVDGAGYDIVLESQSVVRHIQLKAARVGGRRSSVGVNVKLASKPSGCVVWVYFSPDTLKLGPFLWLGNEPGAPLLLADLGPKVGRHTKADATGNKAERPGIREVPKSRFIKVETVPELVARLFDIRPAMQTCPICKSEVPESSRYPRRLCVPCSNRARSADGRLLAFSNVDLSGGFVATFVDNGEKHESHECFVDGVKCQANEAYQGGIVVEAVMSTRV